MCYSDDLEAQGYEVTVSCAASSGHFRETEYAEFTETIDPLIGWLLDKHAATGCQEEPRVFDAHGQGVAAYEDRVDRANSL